jgi:Protein of unknown function (DUF1800)
LAIASAYAIPLAEDCRPLHVLNRLAFGPRPGGIEEVRRTGAAAYIERQLDPESISEPQELHDRIAALLTLGMTPVELFDCTSSEHLRQSAAVKKREMSHRVGIQATAC